MTTTHHIRAQANARRVLAVIGTILVAAPLVAGALAALIALTGRLGGPSNAPTAFWYVALAIGWFALAGALVLLFVHWRTAAWRPILVASLVALGGWVFAIGSAQLSGLANAADTEGMVWQFVLLGVGVVTYLLGLGGLTVLGARASKRDA